MTNPDDLFSQPDESETGEMGAPVPAVPGKPKRAKETAEQRNERIAKRMRADLRWMMKEPRGKRFLGELLRPLQDPGFNVNPIAMAFMQGQRDAAKKLYAYTMDANPTALARIVSDAIVEDARFAGLPSTYAEEEDES